MIHVKIKCKGLRFPSKYNPSILKNKKDDFLPVTDLLPRFSRKFKLALIRNKSQVIQKTVRA